MLDFDRFEVGCEDIQDLNECIGCGDTVYATGDHWCLRCLDEMEE